MIGQTPSHYRISKKHQVHQMDRRRFLVASFVSSLGAGLSNCATPATDRGLFRSERRFAIPEISWDRVIRTVVGLRPTRRSGFRVETEQFGNKTVVHNYGHGPRGVGMSWGTSLLAVEEALKTDRSRFAVIGCGAVGLATARLLQRKGFDVTIYAKDLPPNTTSNVAEAQFDPDVLPEDFGELRDRYVRAARISHRYYQDLVGDYYGVRWFETYYKENEQYRGNRERDLLRDLYHYKVLSPEEHPFGPFAVVRCITMQIQTPIYLNAVVRDFHFAGGRIVVREFADQDDVLSLSEPVIMNCSGLGAKTLFADEELFPVKGQITILLPQPEIDYAAFRMSSRQDGLLLHSGGVAEEGVWSLEPNEELARRLVNEAREFWSDLST